MKKVKGIKRNKKDVGNEKEERDKKRRTQG